MASLPPIDLPPDATGAGVFDEPAAGAARDALFDYVLRLGDDSLILGQRLSEWCGHAPSVEVDLSLANMGLDLVEQPNGDFAQTMARQFLFSTWQKMLFDRLTGSRDELIAAVAAKAVKEVAYHEELSAEWVIRLGDGTDESRQRMIEGLDWMWRFVPELFEMDEVAESMAQRGIGVDLAAFRDDYLAKVSGVIAEATLDQPKDQRPILGGRRGHHSEHLGHLLAVMQFLPRTYPDATW